MDDKKKIRIAAASSDGIVVNRHFGKAETFYIYEVEGEEVTLLEVRKLSPVCNSGNHDPDRLKTSIKKLSDCRYLLVSRIGNGAEQMAECFGLKAYELPGIITESIQKMLQHIRIQSLFQAFG